MRSLDEFVSKFTNLDCAQSFIVSNFSGDALLRIGIADLQLLTNREHLGMAKNVIRGGVASVFDKRLATANNNLVQNFDSTQPSTFLFMIDTKSLYGGIIENFEFNDKIPLDEIMKNIAISDIGFILGVDMTYPDNLYDGHSDYPLAPTKEVVSKLWLSYVQIDMMKQLNISDKVSTTPKLNQNFFPKKTLKCNTSIFNCTSNWA